MRAQGKLATGLVVGAMLAGAAFAASAVGASGQEDTQRAGRKVVKQDFAPEGRSGGKPKMVCSASVAADGTLMAGVGVVSVTAFGSGNYEVLCKKKIQTAKCVNTISIGEFDYGESPVGFATTNVRAGDEKGVWVSTYDVDGAEADLPFNLHVTC